MPEIRTTTLTVNKTLSVTCLHRANSNSTLLMSVREWDTKILRQPGAKTRKEQTMRSNIRQAIVNMRLRTVKATKPELRLLKSKGVLAKGSPSASLLPGTDVAKLLKAFGKTTLAQSLEAALKKDGYESEGEETQEPLVADAVYLTEESCDDDEDDNMSDDDDSDENAGSKRPSLWDERKQAPGATPEKEEEAPEVRRSARSRKPTAKTDEEEKPKEAAAPAPVAAAAAPAAEEPAAANRKRKPDEAVPDGLNALVGILDDLKNRAADPAAKRQKKEEPTAETKTEEVKPAAEAAAEKKEVPNHGENETLKLLPYPIVLLLHKLKGTSTPPPPALPHLLYANAGAMQNVNPQFYNQAAALANQARYRNPYAQYPVYMQGLQNTGLQMPIGFQAGAAGQAATAAAAQNWAAVNAANNPQARRVMEILRAQGVHAHQQAAAVGSAAVGGEVKPVEGASASVAAAAAAVAAAAEAKPAQQLA